MKNLFKRQITWTTTDEWTGEVTTHTAPAPTRAQRRLIEQIRRDLANPVDTTNEEW